MWYDIFGDNVVSYEGIFLDDESVRILKELENKLSGNIENINSMLHCTFKYQPTNEELFDEIVGMSYEMFIIGYGNDGKNSGFLISLPEELKKYYINYNELNELKKVHITTTLAPGAKASDTQFLYFRNIDVPIKISGRFGYLINTEDGIEFCSFDPVKAYTKIINRRKRSSSYMDH